MDKKQILEEITEEFIKGGGQQALKEAREKITPYLALMAEVKFDALAGGHDNYLAAMEVESLWNGVSDITQGLKEKLENYYILRTEKLLKDMLFKHVIKAVIPS